MFMVKSAKSKAFSAYISKAHARATKKRQIKFQQQKLVVAISQCMNLIQFVLFFISLSLFKTIKILRVCGSSLAQKLVWILRQKNKVKGPDGKLLLSNSCLCPPVNICLTFLQMELLQISHSAVHEFSKRRRTVVWCLVLKQIGSQASMTASWPQWKCQLTPVDWASNEKGSRSWCLFAAVYAFADRLGRFENFCLFRVTKAHIRSVVGESMTWQGPRAGDALLCLCI